MTHHRSRSHGGETTTNQHFFSQLGQRVIKVVNRLGPQGRLYELDPRLRPTGRSGMLAVSLDEFARYFSGGQGQLWERQALCRARPIFGSVDARQNALGYVRLAIVQLNWTPEHAGEIYHMRSRLQETASPRNLKRGPGGTVDVEFTVQMLQLRHALDSPQVLTPGTLDALSALHECGHLGEDDFQFFSESYRFLRSVEARLRLMNTTAQHDIPEHDADLEKLAYLLGRSSSQSLLDDCRYYTQENRLRFERFFSEAMA